MTKFMEAKEKDQVINIPYDLRSKQYPTLGFSTEEFQFDPNFAKKKFGGNWALGGMWIN